jgi:hypothetical protein
MTIPELFTCGERLAMKIAYAGDHKSARDVTLPRTFRRFISGVSGGNGKEHRLAGSGGALNAGRKIARLIRLTTMNSMHLTTTKPLGILGAATKTVCQQKRFQTIRECPPAKNRRVICLAPPLCSGAKQPEAMPMSRAYVVQQNRFQGLVEKFGEIGR